MHLSGFSFGFKSLILVSVQTILVKSSFDSLMFSWNEYVLRLVRVIILLQKACKKLFEFQASCVLVRRMCLRSEGCTDFIAEPSLS